MRPPRGSPSCRLMKEGMTRPTSPWRWVVLVSALTTANLLMAFLSVNGYPLPAPSHLHTYLPTTFFTLLTIGLSSTGKISIYLHLASSRICLICATWEKKHLMRACLVIAIMNTIQPTTRFFPEELRGTRLTDELGQRLDCEFGRPCRGTPTSNLKPEI